MKEATKPFFQKDTRDVDGGFLALNVLAKTQA
jgi:hypothetical protein